MNLPLHSNPTPLAGRFSRISQMLGQSLPIQTSVPQAFPPAQPSLPTDRLQLLAPNQLFAPRNAAPPRQNIALSGLSLPRLPQGANWPRPRPSAPALSLPELRQLSRLNPSSGPSQDWSQTSPRQQLLSLGQKYGVPYDGSALKSYQSKVIKAIIRVKAREKGIPENIALAIAGNESGWKMWKDPEQGRLIEGRNVRNGKLLSTDWGAMQINDHAHAKAFPRAQKDLEYNIEYGLSYLARQRKNIQGNLGLGFGDWDRTIASYNLGHNPHSERGYSIAQNYVSHVHKHAYA